MRIGVDLDDVLIDFAGALIQHYNPIIGKNYTREQNRTFHIEDMWKCTKAEASNRINEFSSRYDPSTILPFPDAQNIIQALQKNNELFIITGRSLSVIEKTRETVEFHFPNMFKEIYFTNYGNSQNHSETKASYCKKLNIDLFIDDYHQWATQIAEVGIETLLFDAPWNRMESHPKIKRVYNWKEIHQHIKQMNH